MLSIIHIITIGTMLNFKNGNKGHRGLFDNFEIKIDKTSQTEKPWIIINAPVEISW